jgi:hypothetical protein
MEDNATGKFVYGYKLIDSLQMVYHESYSFCDRLYFLINHWLANWDLIPESVFNPFPSQYNLTKCTLMPDTTGSSLITGTGVFGTHITDKKVSYSEVMFQSTTEYGEAFYGQVVKNIDECLRETKWDFESEEINDDKYTRYISHFYKNGVSRDKPHTSINVTWKKPYKADIIHQYEVVLEFN